MFRFFILLLDLLIHYLSFFIWKNWSEVHSGLRGIFKVVIMSLHILLFIIFSHIHLYSVTILDAIYRTFSGSSAISLKRCKTELRCVLSCVEHKFINIILNISFPRDLKIIIPQAKVHVAFLANKLFTG